MKISEVTLNIIKDHCGISGDDSDELLGVFQTAALGKITGYTGLTAEEADGLEDLTYAYLTLIDEMYSSRTYTVDNADINPTAKQIMDMHCRNLIV